MSEGELYLPPSWSPPTPEDLQRMTASLDEARARRKAAEKAYPVRGGDFIWWAEDPPTRAWTVEGVLCAVNPAPRPGLCGYVQLPPGHPWRALDLVAWEASHPDVEVHGGISWHHSITHWIGFDTGHGFDYWPPEEIERAREAGLVTEQDWTRWEEMRAAEAAAGLRNGWASFPNSRAWSWEQVVAETVVLAGQVKAAAG